jgi:hypothetical protein
VSNRQTYIKFTLAYILRCQIATEFPKYPHNFPLKFNYEKENICTLNNFWKNFNNKYWLEFHELFYPRHTVLPFPIQDSDFTRNMSVYFWIQWMQRSGECRLCWYWWNCWPSLLKFYFRGVIFFIVVVKVGLC